MTRKKDITINLETIAKTIPDYLNNEVLPTSYYILDKALNGGVELGSTIQIVGESGTGKSTLSLLIAKEFCQQGKNVVYLDTENSISKEMVFSMGLNKFMESDCNRFYYLRLSTFSDVENKLDEFISTGKISLIICDSLAGLINEGFTNLNGGISISNVASSYNSRPLGMFMNKYKVLVTQHKIAFVFTNQYRNKIDIRGKTGTQKKEYGGKNIKHNSDIIIKLDICRDKLFKGIAEAYSKVYCNGISETIGIAKSNKGEPKEYLMHLCYVKGISNVCNYIYALIKSDIIKQSGTYYSILFNGQEVKENGMERFISYIYESQLNLYDLYKREIDTFYSN